MSQFVHLHNHTHYSILDAITTVKSLVKAAKEDNQTAIAITDHGVMFGTIEFYKECTANDIKPIIGCEVYIANGSRFEQTSGQQANKKKNYFHLLLLAKNEQGYKNLMILSSLAHTEGFYYRPRIDKELLEKHSEGLICTTACMGGLVPALLLDNQYEEAKQVALYYKNIFGNDFYIELQRHSYPLDDFLIKKLIQLSKEINVKLIATNDTHYLKKTDAIAHNAYLLIKDGKGKTESRIEELRYKTDEFYFRTQAEMQTLFEDCPEAISNTLEIADKCNLKLELGELQMPEFPIPAGMTADEYLKKIVFEGLEQKYSLLTEEIVKRAEYELSVIAKMKFPGYFLIVWDFIREAKQIGVRVGPGRGSAAGSIVAYALSITNVDPLKYGLLFERFLNPERVSMPDIDIDFNDITRYKIIEYVQSKYGENSVAQIITFGTLAAKAVITDIGRVLGLPLDKVKQITKEISFQESISSAKQKKSLTWTKEESDPRYQQLWDLCETLEGVNRNLGTHAAGVVIAPSDITNYAPLYRADKSTSAGEVSVTQYEMKWLEEAGLVKMDFLGLKSLSIIDRTLEMIKDNHNLEIDIDSIDFNDTEVYKMLGNGLTKAIFQFESSGMQEYLKQLKPQNLEELTAMNALYRPGPMDNIPNFINRKHNIEPIKYLHPIMEKSLENTYGVIVYQEQVMQLVQDLAGFSLGQADVMRRAMGKKKKEEMIKLKTDFTLGCAKNNISTSLAEEIYELILAFASYGFNKSHSLAYSYLAFQTAWLKSHYTAEFLAANMTAEMNVQAELVSLIDEAKKFNIKVLAPDINTSNTNFIAKNGSIYFGLAGIKGVGIAAVDNIVEVRQKQVFTSIFDFAIRVEQCNKRILEALIGAGAFDSIHTECKRAQLFASVDMIMEFAKKVNSSNSSNNNTDHLFANETSAVVIKEPDLIFVPEWDNMERIKKEKEYLNFYLSGHPLDKYYSIVNSLNSIKLTSNMILQDTEVAESKEQEVESNISTYGYVSGIITSVRHREDKKQNGIAFVSIQNYDGEAELAFWSHAYKRYKYSLEDGEIICCQGRIERNVGEITKVTVDNLCSAEDAISKYTTAIQISIKLMDATCLKKLDAIGNYQSNFSVNEADSRIIFKVYDSENDYSKLYSTNMLQIPYTAEAINYLTEVFGKENISLWVKKPAAPSSNRANWKNKK